MEEADSKTKKTDEEFERYSTIYRTSCLDKQYVVVHKEQSGERNDKSLQSFLDRRWSSLECKRHLVFLFIIIFEKH